MISNLQFDKFMRSKITLEILLLKIISLKKVQVQIFNPLLF